MLSLRHILLDVLKIKFIMNIKQKQLIYESLILFLSISIIHYSCKKYGKLIAVETCNVADTKATGANVDPFIVSIYESSLLEQEECKQVNPNQTLNNRNFKL